MVVGVSFSSTIPVASTCRRLNKVSPEPRELHLVMDERIIRFELKKGNWVTYATRKDTEKLVSCSHFMDEVESTCSRLELKAGLKILMTAAIVIAVVTDVCCFR